MRRIKREFVFFGCFLFFVVFAWIVLGVFLKTDTPVVIISSSSMEPALNAGDVVFVRAKDAGALKAGDIIVYKCPSKEKLCVEENRLIAHRIVEINETYWIKTKGDANERWDRWLVEFSWIKGEMFFRVPILGKPIVLFKNVIGLV